jgi:hypothetical protein
MSEGVISREKFLAEDMSGLRLFILRQKNLGEYQGRILAVRTEGDDLIVDCDEFASRQKEGCPWEKIGGKKSFRISLSTQAGFFQAAERMFLVYPKNDPEPDILIFKPSANE